jgi:hypothetical protein
MSRDYILNCIPSAGTDQDWTFEDAIDAAVVQIPKKYPGSVDLREDWWAIDNQGGTGACVGYATAYGVLRWHYFRAGLITEEQAPSARFIWMANKETDQLVSYPTTFIETTGTQTKLALRVARKYGCVLEDDLPMQGPLSSMSRARFYTRAARMRIASYHNLGRSLKRWRRWLAYQGPILTRLNVDKTWDDADENEGHLETYQKKTVRGGHAVCLVGYTPEYFIVRNSWGTNWGDEGFAYAHDKYAKKAFTEAYGAVM